jgi:hypothetical protein
MALELPLAPRTGKKAAFIAIRLEMNLKHSEYLGVVKNHRWRA